MHVPGSDMLKIKIKIKDEDFKDLSKLPVLYFCKVPINLMVNWYFFP